MKNPAYILPSAHYKRKATIFSVLSIIVIGCCWLVEFNPFGFFSEFHFVQDLLSEMFPPNFEIIWDDNSMAMSILQTLSMAFLGTFYGGFVAIILSFLSGGVFVNIIILDLITALIKSSIISPFNDTFTILFVSRSIKCSFQLGIFFNNPLKYFY